MSLHRPPTVALKTLGCKLNQFETQQIRESLQHMGFVPVPFEGPADVYVINSCTVTAHTDRDCRRLIRHARKLSAGALIVVTGCYAEVSPDAVADVAQADLVVGNRSKPSLPQRIADEMRRRGWAPAALAHDATRYAGAHMLEGFADHTRAFVKVQEGCDAACTYCIVPRARGASRSVPLPDVLAQARSLIAAGFPELVLIGIHLGKYGLDLPDAPDLTGLVQELCALPGLGRLRLSSLEPREVPEALVDLVAHEPRVCRHLHIPLQSGSDAVLRRMNRPYDAAFYTELVGRIHALEPDICLGADVMVGFPGETDEEFEECLALVQQLPLHHLHVFTYSQRPGTPAAEMPSQVPHEVKIARNHRLRDLSEVKRTRFARSQIGQRLGVVFERPAHGRPGHLDGLSDNYLRVVVPGPEDLLGALEQVEVTGAVGDELQGQLLDLG
jgi:threonylcarbamoyladenosine tRNA methylthiotransferase MtaB